MLDLQEAYKPRAIRFLELWQIPNWQLKVYGIAYEGEYPRDILIDAAKELARHELPDVSAMKNHYGVGFLGIHDGRDANFVFLDFWADENELHHHVYVSPADAPADLDDVTGTGLTACVWDLRVLCFERQAWIDTVLANPDGPDIAAYLERRLTETV